MELLFLALYASLLGAALGGPVGAHGDNVDWWSVDSASLLPSHGSSHQDVGMNQWFTVYPDSYKHNEGSWLTTSTLPPHENSQHSGGYQIIDLRN